MAKIIIPTPLRKFTNAQKEVEVNGNNISEAIASLADAFPAVKQHLLEAEGNIRPFVRIYLGDEDIQVLQQEATQITPQSVISIIPAIAGGK